MEIGTGIAVGCAILGCIIAVLRILAPKVEDGSESVYLLGEVFEEYKEGTTQQLKALTRCNAELKDGLKRIHARIDTLIAK